MSHSYPFSTDDYDEDGGQRQLVDYHRASTSTSAADDEIGDEDIHRFVEEEDTERREKRRRKKRRMQQQQQQQQATNNNRADDRWARGRYDFAVDDAASTAADSESASDGGGSSNSPRMRYSNDALARFAGGGGGSSQARQLANGQGRPIAGVSNPDEDWQYEGPSDVTFPDVDPSGCPADDTYCFMCDHSQNGQEMVSNPRFNRLKSLWDNHCGLVHPVRLSTMVQEDYDKFLRNKTLLKKPWSVRQIYAHFTEHAASPAGMNEDSLRVINTAMHVLKAQCIFRRETKSRRRELDVQGLSMYLKLLTQRKSLLKEVLGSRPGNVA
jgi:hypothetical protein